MRPKTLGHQPSVAMRRVQAIRRKNLRGVFNRIQVPPTPYHFAVPLSFRSFPYSGHPLRMVREVMILMDRDNHAGNIH